MSFWLRAALAVTILTVDCVTFFLPLMAFVTAVVLLTRPPWFRRFVDALYADLAPPSA